MNKNKNKEQTNKNKEQTDKDKLLMHYIAKNSILDIEKVINDGADMNAWNGYALSYSCRLGYIELVKYFVEKGISVDVDSSAPLREACANSRKEIVLYLLKNKAVIKGSGVENITKDPIILKYLEKEKAIQENRPKNKEEFKLKFKSII